jgi:hypothetical protein
MLDYETHRQIARDRFEEALRQRKTLAVAAPRVRPHRVRRQVGSLLIAAGRKLAPDTSGAGARPAREASAMRARAA